MRSLVGDATERTIEPLEGFTRDAPKPLGAKPVRSGVTLREVTIAVAGGLLLGSSFLLVKTAPRLATGSPSPALALPLVAKGPETIQLVDKGRVTVVDFFASWCGVCKATVPALGRSMRRSGVRFIAVSIDDRASAARAAATTWHIAEPVAWDAGGRARRAFGIRALPTVVVIAPDGSIAATHVGPVSPSKLDAELEHAQDEGPRLGSSH